MSSTIHSNCDVYSLIAESNQNIPSIDYNNNVCNTIQCQRSSQSLLQSMNQDIDPCTNFYEFTCGNWHTTHQRPYWSPKISIFSEHEDSILQTIIKFLTYNSSLIANEIELPELVEKAKNMFDACMDTEKLDEMSFGPIVKYLNEFNLPVIPANILNGISDEIWNEESEISWIKTVARMRKEFGISVLISFNIVPSNANTLRNTIFLSYPDFKNKYRWPE